MTPEQIAAWAKEAELAYSQGAGLFASWQEDHNIAPYITRFAALVAAHERERCAKVCEEISDEYRRREGRKYPELRSDAEAGANACEAAIRAQEATR